MHRGFSTLVPSDYGYENNMPTYQQLLCVHTAIVWQHNIHRVDCALCKHLCMCSCVCVLCAPCGPRCCRARVQPLPLHGVQSNIEEADCLLCEANCTTVKGSIILYNIYTLYRHRWSECYRNLNYHLLLLYPTYYFNLHVLHVSFMQRLYLPHTACLRTQHTQQLEDIYVHTRWLWQELWLSSICMRD